MQQRAEERRSTFDQPPATVVFGSTTDTVEIEVDYAKGAAPSTGIVPGVGADAWGLFATNAKRIFAKTTTTKTLTIPSTLAEMEALDITGDSFTEDDILAIADAHRNKRSAGALATFYVVWLPGYFDDGHGVKKDVLGVTIGATGVTAMFKGAIDASSGAVGFQSALLEQFTLLHEFGHAVGLVDNGIQPATAHRDTSHGAHCSNPACAMYHANEGIAAALNFARRDHGRRSDPARSRVPRRPRHVRRVSLSDTRVAFEPGRAREREREREPGDDDPDHPLQVQVIIVEWGMRTSAHAVLSLLTR